MPEGVYQLPDVSSPDNTDLFEVFQQTDNTRRRVSKLNAAQHYGFELQTVVNITSAQLLALNATEQEVIAAPGANLAIIPTLFAVRKPAGTAYAGVATGEDLVLKYTDDSGAVCAGTVETTGLLDSTSETLAVAGPSEDSFVPVANAAIVLHLLSGEVITGDSDLEVLIRYKVIPTNFAA